MGSMRNLISVVLAVLLSMASVSWAFAVEPDQGETGDSVPMVPEGNGEGLGGLEGSSGGELDGVEEEDPESEPAEPIVDNEISVDEEPDALPLPEGEEGISLFSVIGSDYIYQVDLEQQDETTVVAVTLPNADALVESGKADRVVVDGVMNYNGVITRQVTAEKALSELAQSGFAFDLDFATYGKFSVTAKFYLGETLVATGDTQTLGIVADEYNIAPVSATLPVTFFSLSLWGEDSIRYADDGGIVPTVVLMERPNAWDWDNLPEGVYPLPFLSKEEVAYQPSDFTEASDLFRDHASAMAAYVHDLYEMNPHSMFNLYLVDYYLGQIQSVLYANGIPQDQYTITVLSDGSFSYSRFNSAYSGANPVADHEARKAAWMQARDEAYATGMVSPGFAMWEPASNMYAAVDCEPSAEWWLARPALLQTAGDGNAFGASAQANAKVVRFYIDRKLASLQESGGTAVEEFKALYNFSESYFADAEAAGKQVMLFLGTTVASEGGSFSDYARFTMKFYGDDYQYYYKGHPGSPTDFHPAKQEELKALGITDVDSSVAAELILFFYPDIFLSGYTSSTYASLQNPDMAKGLFRITKADAVKNESYAMMDWFMSPIGSASDARVQALAANDASYLVEFSDDYLDTVDYDIAVWDSLAESISYYRDVDGSYVLVGSEVGGSDYDLRTIKLGLDDSKVVDIRGASAENGANVQVYANNRSMAQRYRLIELNDGSYLIRNVGSGKVLDVESAGTANGTNVHQYQRNDTAAQKWWLEPVNGEEDMYRIKSACNGLYLDVCAGDASNGANLQVYEGNGTDAQKFKLEPIKPVVEDGVRTIQSSLSNGTGAVLDVRGASVDNKANVQLYERNGTSAQNFMFTYDPLTGYYSIANENSGKMLDVAGGEQTAGTNVWQYAGNDSVAQKWSVEEAVDSRGNASFVIYSATGGGCCLDVAGGEKANSTNVWIYYANGTDAQKWRM